MTGLPERHRRALAWFEDRSGSVVPWPEPLDDGTLLATKAKGIYKPRWSPYALSVRQSLQGPYPDREIDRNSDGTWRFQYFQENLDPGSRDIEFTNQGLLACNRDTVPVGVLRQIRGKPNARYEVVGLAFVNGWESGYFVLEGVQRLDPPLVREPRSIVPYAGASLADIIASPFDALNTTDESERALRAIRVRQGQTGFRAQLLSAYDRRCAISSYDAPEALDAAHIIPYRGPVTNHPQNGLLLRSDLHNLFDLGLIAVGESDLRVIVSRQLRGTKYEQFADAMVRVPELDSLRPSRMALARHRLSASL